MSLSPDNPFRTHSAFRRCNKRAKADPEALALLERSYRAAWGGHGAARRVNVLHYLISNIRYEAIDLIELGLRSRSRHVQGTAAIAAYTYVRDGMDLSVDLQKTLLRVIWKSTSASTVGFALWAIEPSMTEDDYVALLESMRVKHPKSDSRFDAAYELLRRGREYVTADLIREMPLCEYPNYAAERILWERVRGFSRLNNWKLFT